MLYIEQTESVNSHVDWGGDPCEVRAAVSAHPDSAIRVCEGIAADLHPDRAIALARTILKSAKRGYGKNARVPDAPERKLRRKQHAISSALAVLHVCRWAYR